MDMLACTHLGEDMPSSKICRMDDDGDGRGGGLLTVWNRWRRWKQLPLAVRHAEHTAHTALKLKSESGIKQANAMSSHGPN